LDRRARKAVAARRRTRRRPVRRRRRERATDPFAGVMRRAAHHVPHPRRMCACPVAGATGNVPLGLLECVAAMDRINCPPERAIPVCAPLRPRERAARSRRLPAPVPLSTGRVCRHTGPRICRAPSRLTLFESSSS
jgi:hypothetical protein